MCLYFSEAPDGKDTCDKNSAGGRHVVRHCVRLSWLQTPRRGHVVQEQPSTEKSQGNNVSI